MRFPEESTSANMPILRYYVAPERREEHLQELIETCHRVGAHEVLLFTSTAYARGANFIDREQLKSRMNHLHMCADRIRSADLVFSLNVFTTLGHIYVPQEEIDRFGFKRQIDPEGRDAIHPVLDPSCLRLREYQSGVYETYAELEPRLMFVDDDFGVNLHSGFHPDRLRRFAAAISCSSEREHVKSLMFSEDRAIALQARKLMRTLITRDLVELAVILRQAAHRRDPRIRLGLMYPARAFFDVAAVAEAFAGAHRPYVRPQLPLYREERSVASYGEALWQLNYWRAKLPANFEIFPEGENLPYTDLQKSPAATFLHTAYCFACGEPKVALSLNSFSTGIPAGDSRQSTAFTAAHKPQLQVVAGLLAGGSEPIGIGVWEAGEPRMTGVLPKTPFSLPQLLGFPIYSARQPEDAVIHWGHELYDLPSKEIEQVLESGAVLDLDSAAILEARGYLSRTGLALDARCRVQDILNLEFTRRDASVENWMIYYFIRNVSEEGMPRRIRTADGTVLNSYKDDLGQTSVPFALTWSGPLGQPFAFINASFHLWPRGALWNPWMADVLKQTFEWVQGKAVAAQVVNGPNLTVNALKLPATDQVILTLINYSTTSQANTQLALSEELAGLSFTEIAPDGSGKDIPVQQSESRMSLHLQGATECLGVRFILGTQR